MTRSRRWLQLAGCALVAAGLWLADPARTAAQDDDDELEGLDDDLGPAEDEAELEGEDAVDPDAVEEAEADPTLEVEPAGSGPPARTLLARASVGGGFGTRQLRRPLLRGGEQRLEPVYFAAADLGIGVRIWPEDAFSLDVLIRYRTSLGLVIQEQPLFALVNEVAVRSEHAELSVAPGFALGPSPTGTRFSIPLGLSMRNFWPAEHQLLTPRYTLFGPHARFELDVALGEIVRVRLAPEVQLFGVVGTDLTAAGVSSVGFAVGGEAGIEFRLSSHFSLDLELRQSWASASADGGRSFRDSERFVTARFAGEM